MEIRAQATSRIEAFEQNQLIRSLSARLAGSFGMETMIRQLSEGLQRLGIRSGYLVLFAAETEAGPQVPRTARLVMASPGPQHGGEKSAVFDARLLLPPRYLPRFDEGVWILEPLVFQEEALGYLILEGTHRDPAIFENLRDQVSSTLKGSLLMEKITGHEQELEIEVERRTQELRKANLELRSLLAQRKALEREVQEISDKTMQTIGQDLHDDLCQNLAGISMFVSLLESELKEVNPALVESAARIRRMLEDSISRTRRIARGLYPPGLEERGLVATLEDLFDSVTRTGKVTIGLQVAPSFPPLVPALALQVFRIIQEAVSNAIRHSGTDHIDVRLGTEGGRAWAEIQDFGFGLDSLSHDADDQGMGLKIMRYRAESIGAELTIEKLAPGFRIACRWDEKAQGDSHG
jgi:signal transduction histidine kinase